MNNKCIQCKKEFIPNKHTPYQKYCSISCRGKHYRESGKGRKKLKKYHASPKGKYNYYKKNASRAHRIFILSLSEFTELISKPCTYCGKIGNPYNGVDRTNNNKGYIKENCTPCCAYCNWMKREKSFGEFVNHCKEVAKKWKTF